MVNYFYQHNQPQSTAAVIRSLVNRGPCRSCPGLLFCLWSWVDILGPAKLTSASPVHRAWAWKQGTSLSAFSYDSNYSEFICAFAMQGALSLPDTKLPSTVGNRLGWETQHLLGSLKSIVFQVLISTQESKSDSRSFRGTFSSRHWLSSQRFCGSLPALSSLEILWVTMQMVSLR